MGNVLGSQRISGMCRKHHSQIYNVTRRSCSKEFHADICKKHSVFYQGMRVNVNEICEIIEDLSYNKSSGLEGITSEHMKLANRQLPVLHIMHVRFV